MCLCVLFRVDGHDGGGGGGGGGGVASVARLPQANEEMTWQSVINDLWRAI